MNPQKILVIGATGKIGRLVVDALNQNHFVLHTPASSIANAA